MTKRTLLVVFVLFIGVRGTSAAACGDTSVTALTGGATCTCPTGAGTLATSGGTGTLQWTSATVSGVSTITATGSNSFTATQAAALCSDLLAGYYVSAASTAPATCTGSGKYCLGKANLYSSGNVLVWTSGTTYTYPSAVTGATVALGGRAACPTGFGNTASVSSVDETSCVDILPGYYQVGAIGAAADLTVATGTAVAACPAGNFCPGKTGALSVSGTSRIDVVASTWDGVSTGTFVTTSGTIAAATVNVAPNKLTCAGNTVNIICPAGTTGTATNSGSSIVSGDLANIAGELLCGTGYAPDATAANCVTTAGYYGASQNTPVSGSTTTTAAAKTCASNTVNIICPAGTTGTATNTGSNIVSADLANINGEILCGTGYQPDANAANCIAKSGYYGASTNTLASGSTTTTSAATACPTGITTTQSSNSGTGQTGIAGCTDLSAGYAVLSAIAQQTTAGALTTLTAGITTCPNNKYCPGAATVFSITFVAAGPPATYTYSAVSVPAAGSGAPVACPTGTGNTLTGAAAQGVNAVSAATACVDLLAGYALAVVSTQTALPGTLIVACSAGTYNCGGLAGLFVANAPISGTGISIASGTSMAMTSANPPVLPQAVTVTAPGTLIKGSCPSGSTNSAAGATIASCLAQPGYYIDASGLSTPVACSVGEYCPGDAGQYLTAAGALATASVPVGTAGGDYNCPAGSVAPGTAPSTSNSALNDCNLLPNFYIPTGTGAALYVPVSCPAGSHCPGGGAIGTAGGSFACPANSTIPACTVAAVTAPSVTVTAAAAPAVTVAAAAAPAVTVAAGAAPIVNVTVPAPIYSAAPRAAAHAAVLALAALAALVSF